MTRRAPNGQASARKTCLDIMTFEELIVSRHHSLMLRNHGFEHSQ
jgi:hypothetical protein